MHAHDKHTAIANPMGYPLLVSRPDAPEFNWGRSATQRGRETDVAPSAHGAISAVTTTKTSASPTLPGGLLDTPLRGGVQQVDLDTLAGIFGADQRAPSALWRKGHVQHVPLLSRLRRAVRHAVWPATLVSRRRLGANASMAMVSLDHYRRRQLFTGFKEACHE